MISRTILKALQNAASNKNGKASSHTFSALYYTKVLTISCSVISNVQKQYALTLSGFLQHELVDLVHQAVLHVAQSQDLVLPQLGPPSNDLLL